MNVYQRLNDAREKFHALKLQKTGHNKFAGYYYFELGDFLIPALKVFRECGLCAFVTFEKDVARMAIISVDEPEPMAPGKFILIESPMGSAALKGCHEVQNIGAVETYQRRYLWVAALEIVEHDALDATTGKDKAEPKKAEPVTTVEPPKTGAMADTLKELPPLSPEDELYFKELAEDVTALFNTKGAAVAFDRIEIEQLDNEQKVHLSSRLHSKVRTALKTEKGMRIGAA